MRYVDLYGKTTLNRLQMDDLVEDIEVLEAPIAMWGRSSHHVPDVASRKFADSPSFEAARGSPTRRTERQRISLLKSRQLSPKHISTNIVGLLFIIPGAFIATIALFGDGISVGSVVIAVLGVRSGPTRADHRFRGMVSSGFDRL
jgi:hypothetical protein